MTHISSVCCTMPAMDTTQSHHKILVHVMPMSRNTLWSVAAVHPLNARVGLIANRCTVAWSTVSKSRFGQSFPASCTAAATRAERSGLAFKKLRTVSTPRCLVSDCPDQPKTRLMDMGSISNWILSPCPSRIQIHYCKLAVFITPKLRSTCGNKWLNPGSWYWRICP